jgi:hypothetical protein
MKSRLALLCKIVIFLQVSCTRDDLLLMCWFFVFFFHIYIKYLELLTIENTILIFHFYK